MKNLGTINFELREQVAIVTLNRPEYANGINFELASELAYVAAQCDNNDEVKCVVLTGQGRFFCSGGDIKEMASHGERASYELKRLADQVHLAISTFSRMRAPVIVAVNGIAAGAGFSLAIAGDIVVASEDSKFVMAYTKSGLSPDGGSSYYLPRLVGLRRAQTLMFTNKQLNAAEALEWGLLTEVVTSEVLMNRAVEIASSLAAGSATANAAVKSLLLSSFDKSLETQMAIEGREISYCAKTRNGMEGIKAFVEKRRPIFR